MTTANDLFTAIQQQATATALNVASEQALSATFRERSEAMDPTEGFVLPVSPATKTLRGYQTAAVETCLTHRKAIIGFSPGMGKTVVAQAVAAAVALDGGRTVVVCPPSLRVDPWVREFAKDFPQLNVVLVEGQKAAEIPAGDVLIVGDSVLSHRLDDIKAWDPTALIIDEAQRMKNRAAKRSKKALDLADSIEAAHAEVATTVLLTGTLSMNRPDEVYMPTRIAGKRVARQISGSDSYHAFQVRWCETEFNRFARTNVTIGCSDPEGLHERLRESVYVRVERDAVLDMPEKVWSVNGLSLNGDLAAYRRAEKDFLRWIAESRGDEAAMRAMKAEALVKMMYLWQEAGKAKIKAATEYVVSLVEQGEQVVVMGVHRSVVEGMTKSLMDEGIMPALAYGGMTNKQKDQAIDEFKDGTADVMVGNIETIGTGKNLENSAHLVFVQLPWSPSDMTQASDRIYRAHTQKRDCTIHVLNALGTVDERMYGVLQAKAHIVDLINAGTTGISMGDEETVTTEVLSSYGW